MTPFDHVVQLYAEHPGMDFEADLEAHFRHGYVVATPEAFAMARLVRRDWTPERLNNPFHAEPAATADCWFIWVLAGDLTVAARWLPFDLPWNGFARRGKAAKYVEAGALLQKALAKAK